MRTEMRVVCARLLLAGAGLLSAPVPTVGQWYAGYTNSYSTDSFPGYMADIKSGKAWAGPVLSYPLEVSLPSYVSAKGTIQVQFPTGPFAARELSSGDYTPPFVGSAFRLRSLATDAEAKVTIDVTFANVTAYSASSPYVGIRFDTGGAECWVKTTPVVVNESQPRSVRVTGTGTCQKVTAGKTDATMFTSPGGARIAGQLHVSTSGGPTAPPGQPAFWLVSDYQLSATPPTGGGPDLSVDRIEIVQAVQYEDNLVPLVARKQTVVRVFPKVLNSTVFIEGVTGTLRAIKNGVEMRSFSPLRPFNAPMTAKSDPQRTSQWDSLDFLLPTGWADEGPTEFIASITGPSGYTDPNTSNNTKSLTRTFEKAPGWPYPFGIGFMLVCHQPPGQEEPLCPSDGVRFRTDFLDKLYPVPSDGIAYYKLPVPPLVWPFPIAGATNGEEIANINAVLFIGQLLYESIDRAQVSVFGGLEQMALWFPRMPGTAFAGYSNPVWNGGSGRVIFAQDTTRTDILDTSHTIAHEIGHNLGLHHPLPGQPDTCGAADGSALNNWPYGDGLINEIGYDPETQTFVPATKNDLMTYCTNPGWNIWISPFSFTELFRLGFAGRFAPLAAPAVSEGKVEAKAAETGDILVIGGSVERDGSSGKLEPALRNTGVPTQSEPAGSHCVRLEGEAGTLAETCFQVNFKDNDSVLVLPRQNFIVRMAARPGIRRITLLKEGTELASRSAGINAPTVRITSPESGARWTGPGTIEWTGSDPDGDSLTYSVSYSADGKAYLPLAINLSEARYRLDTKYIQGGKSVYFRVVASDGINSTTATAGPIEVAQTPALEAAPKQLDFRKVQLGGIGDASFTLKNTGSGPVTLSSMNSDSALFTVLSPKTPPQIPAESSQEVVVRFRPDRAGTQSATLTLKATGLPDITVALSGAGVEGTVATMEVTPASLGFGNVATGQTAEKRVTIRSYGPGALQVTAIRSSNGVFEAASPNLPLSIKSGAQENVVVRFRPTAAGAQTGTLTVTGNDPDRGTATVSLTGSGTSGGSGGGSGGTPQIDFSPSAIDFGSVAAGQTKDLTLTVKFAGSETLTVDNTRLDSPFRVTGGGRGSGALTFTIRFAPTGAGSFSGTIRVSSSDAAAAPVTVNVTGRS